MKDEGKGKKMQNQIQNMNAETSDIENISDNSRISFFMVLLLCSLLLNLKTQSHGGKYGVIYDTGLRP
jgi:hypothetical protein